MSIRIENVKLTTVGFVLTESQIATNNHKVRQDANRTNDGPPIHCAAVSVFGNPESDFRRNAGNAMYNPVKKSRLDALRILVQCFMSPLVQAVFNHRREVRIADWYWMTNHLDRVSKRHLRWMMDQHVEGAREMRHRLQSRLLQDSILGSYTENEIKEHIVAIIAEFVERFYILL
jgi:hypothetical protein